MYTLKKLWIIPLLLVGGIALAGCDMPTQTPTTNTGDDEIATYNQDSWQDIIADSCQSFNDGCNQCMRGEDGEVACTRMYCEVYNEPYCTDDEQPADTDISDQVSGVDRSLYIGLSFEAAQEQAETDGRSIRATIIDGEPQAVTADYRPGRINAEIEDNIVTNISVEGDETSESYVGLTLDEAQNLAAETDRDFRVVSIDGEPQAITMDLRPGRINASLQNDIVVDIQVE